MRYMPTASRLMLTLAVLAVPVATRAATEIGHWSFESCSTTDGSGAGHDLTMTGGVTCEVNGRFGGGMTLNGTDGALFWDGGSDFAPNDHSWSVTAWVRTAAASDTQSACMWMGRWTERSR
jgi:hypothetical protein